MNFWVKGERIVLYGNHMGMDQLWRLANKMAADRERIRAKQDAEKRKCLTLQQPTCSQEIPEPWEFTNDFDDGDRWNDDIGSDSNTDPPRLNHHNRERREENWRKLREILTQETSDEEPRRCVQSNCKWLSHEILLIRADSNLLHSIIAVQTC